MGIAWRAPNVVQLRREIAGMTNPVEIEGERERLCCGDLGSWAARASQNGVAQVAPRGASVVRGASGVGESILQSDSGGDL